MKKGFTLIETLIYIALFTILIGAGFATAFSLIQSGDSLNSKTITNSELDFVLRKIDWATNSASNFTVTSPTELNITRYVSPTSIKFRYFEDLATTPVTKKIEINEGSGWISLTTINVEVNGLNFEEISGVPKGVTIWMDVDGVFATTTKYIRQ